MRRHGLEAADVAAILKLTPRLLLGGVVLLTVAARSDVENADDGGRNRCELARALKRRTTALGNRRAAIWRGISISLRPSRKEGDEGKRISYHSASRRSWSSATTTTTPTATSGAPRGRTRASSRVPSSTPRCRRPPRSRSVEGVEGNPSAI